ncbi:MAG: hypothetical protein PHC54_05440 [Candidatus Omnitrophica bacterium]|nr:hypothetical protein [Candidatus Omnitrophota bacterium]MDD5592656.1 hypothetical protein [Candidatus Omnitrophota bacterium]
MAKKSSNKKQHSVSLIPIIIVPLNAMVKPKTFLISLQEVKNIKVKKVNL